MTVPIIEIIIRGKFSSLTPETFEPIALQRKNLSKMYDIDHRHRDRSNGNYDNATYMNLTKGNSLFLRRRRSSSRYQ